MELTEEHIQKQLKQLARKMGQQNASKLLSVLGRNKQFLNAIETPIGQELLRDAVSNIEDKISLILQEKDEPKDRAELKAYLVILNTWQQRISEYNKDRAVFDKNVSIG